MNDKCNWKYSKGPNKGKVCNKKCNGMFCSKHIINKATTKSDKNEESDTDTIISVIDNVSEICSNNSKISNITQNNDFNDCDNINLSRYFVNDCIRKFLIEHNEIQNILHPQTKSSSSNLSNIMMMAAAGMAPMLIRNLIPSNINTDALHKSETINGSCDKGGIFERTQNGITSNTAKIITTKGENFIKESREDITSTTSITENDIGDGTKDITQIYGIPNRLV